MFGYVRPLEPELKVKEATLYKAHYCALCKALGRYGVLARSLLSYDCAFLALLLCARLEQGEAKSEACIANPFVKKPVMPGNEAFRYAAAVNVFMAHGKLDDDWRDDRSAAALAGRTALSGAYKKAILDYPGAGQAVRGGLLRLSELEGAGCSVMDEAAHAFALLLAQVFALPVDGHERDAMDWLGYNLGRWIYLMDAYDDLDEDHKKRRYNVLLAQFGDPDGARAAGERVRHNLSRSLDEAFKALGLIDLTAQRAMLENILGQGCRARMEQILCERRCAAKSPT